MNNWDNRYAERVKLEQEQEQEQEQEFSSSLFPDYAKNTAMVAYLLAQLDLESLD